LDIGFHFSREVVYVNGIGEQSLREEVYLSLQERIKAGDLFAAN
jgi:hypothetical protein